MKDTIRKNLLVATALFSLACGSASSSKSIGPEGGTLTSDLGVSVTIPPGALATSTKLSLREATDAPAGATVAVELEPKDVHFSRPAILTFSGFDDNGGRRKAMRLIDGSWRALRGSREVESRHEHEGFVDDGSTFGLVDSPEVCDDSSDDDGDGLSDCADTACQSAPACGGGSACITDDSCACGADCVNGACTAVGDLCSTDADCPTGMQCKLGRRHGQDCNFAVCAASDDAVKGHGGGAEHPAGHP